MSHGLWITGSTVYSGTDYLGGLYKSTDKGASWKKTNCPGNKIAWVAATATRIYANNGYTSDQAVINSALLADDTKWTSVSPAGMNGNGAAGADVTFDGKNYIVFACQQKAGVWRYVEPAITATNAVHPASRQMAIHLSPAHSKVGARAAMVVDKVGVVYDVTGKILRSR
jgi:hypothetical protein